MNALAVVPGGLREIAWGRFSVFDQPNPGIPHVHWRYKVPSPGLEQRIASAVASYQGAVRWRFRRGGTADRNMVIDPEDAPPEVARGAPGDEAFSAFVERASGDLEGLARYIKASVGDGA